MTSSRPSDMRLSDFDYELPESFIAQTPLEPRDSSRLLVLPRSGGPIRHHVFRELPVLLRAGDLLVFNNTRVIPARLAVHKITGGRGEILLLRQIDRLTWEAFVGGKGARPGTRYTLDHEPSISAEVVEVLDGPRRVVSFSTDVNTVLAGAGEMPLPPYIHERLTDPERYQTVYAREPGSAAAPTAGLHFTPDLLARIDAMGVARAEVTLHVGSDTFQPVQVDDLTHHHMHGEWCTVSAETAVAVAAAKSRGGRVIAVGTTTTRTLEAAAASAGGTLGAFEGVVDLFISPGFEWRVIDGLITNFHLPKSTLLMLVSALAGRERILDAYETAKAQGYRFFSFGDAMLIA